MWRLSIIVILFVVTCDSGIASARDEVIDIFLLNLLINLASNISKHKMIDAKMISVNIYNKF